MTAVGIPGEAKVIPANPGWMIGYYSNENDKEFKITLEEIIAWRIEYDVDAISPSSHNLENYPRIIIMPNGRVIAYSVGSYDSLEIAKPYLIAEWNKLRRTIVARAKPTSRADQGVSWRLKS